MRRYVARLANFDLEDTNKKTYMKHFYCSTSSSKEPTDDKSWDVRTFQVAVAVAFAVVLNCLMSLSFRTVQGAPLSHHCISVGRFRYSSCPRRRRRCQRATVVMNLKAKKKKISVKNKINCERAVKIFYFSKEISMVVEMDFCLQHFMG
jgi:hypothetical protein